MRKFGLTDFVQFAEHHIGAGIPAAEAKELGLPERDFMPHTLEEKVVTYADKLVTGGRIGLYEEALERFKSELGPAHPAIKRFEALHTEIQKLLGP